MSKFIGRRVNLGLAREASRGVGVAPTFWIPKSVISFDDKITKARSSLSYGNIGAGNQALKALEFAEGSVEMDVLDKSFGLILYSIFGTLSTAGPTDSAYTHTFSLANTNQHTSLTFTIDEPNDDNDLTFELAMIESVTITIVPDDVVKATVNFMSKASVPGSVETWEVSYSAENKFLGRHLTFKLATDTSGLAAASNISVKSLTLNFNKNLIRDDVCGTVSPKDILNQNFTIDGSVELTYEDRSYRSLMVDGSYRAVRIQLTNTDVTIGAATNPSFKIDLSRVDFEAWEAMRPNDEIAMQSINFIANYDLTNENVVNSCTLVNEETGSNY